MKMINRIKNALTQPIAEQMNRLNESLKADTGKQSKLNLTVHADTESREETKELLDFLATLPNVGTISVDLYYGSKIDMVTGKRTNPHPYS